MRFTTMEAVATPRVTCAYLNSYVGKNVTIVGKVIQLRGEDAIIDADGNITAHLNRVSCNPTPIPFRMRSLARPPTSDYYLATMKSTPK